MIIEWLVEMAAGLWGFLADLFPDWEVDEEMISPNGWLGQLFALGYGLEPWVNWGFVTLLGAIPFAVWVIGITVKMVRSLITHIPFIGGSG